MIIDPNNITVYAKTDNSKHYVILNGTRDSFRMRQRCQLIDNQKQSNKLKFVSYKNMMKESHKIINVCEYKTYSKL